MVDPNYFSTLRFQPNQIEPENQVNLIGLVQKIVRVWPHKSIQIQIYYKKFLLLRLLVDSGMKKTNGLMCQCVKFLWSLANRDQNGVIHLAHPRCKIANIIGSEGQGCEKKTSCYAAEEI